MNDEKEALWDDYINHSDNILTRVRALLDRSPEPFNARVDVIYHLAKDLIEEADRNDWTLREALGDDVGYIVERIVEDFGDFIGGD